jgi:hypothetical protein
MVRNSVSVSEISQMNQIMLSHCSGLTTYGKNGVNLVKTIYGNDERLAAFIRSVGEDQKIRSDYILPALGINLTGVYKVDESKLNLSYVATIATHSVEDSYQILESLLDLGSVLDQRGTKFAHTDKFAKVSVINTDVNSKLEIDEIRGLNSLNDLIHCHKVRFLVKTNFGDKKELVEKINEN